jgi:HD-like signal output (HDOD) protein
MQNLNHSNHLGGPVPPDAIAAIQLLDLFRDPDRDIDRIVEFINNDPALTAETLKRCNNGLFRGAEQTYDVFEAVSRLGFYELYDIIAASTGARTSSPDSNAMAELEAFQAEADKSDNSKSIIQPAEHPSRRSTTSLYGEW